MSHEAMVSLGAGVGLGGPSSARVPSFSDSESDGDSLQDLGAHAQHPRGVRGDAASGSSDALGAVVSVSLNEAEVDKFILASGPSCVMFALWQRCRDVANTSPRALMVRMCTVCVDTEDQVMMLSQFQAPLPPSPPTLINFQELLAQSELHTVFNVTQVRMSY